MSSRLSYISGREETKVFTQIIVNISHGRPVDKIKRGSKTIQARESSIVQGKDVPYPAYHVYEWSIGVPSPGRSFRPVTFEPVVQIFSFHVLYMNFQPLLQDCRLWLTCCALVEILPCLISAYRTVCSVCVSTLTSSTRFLTMQSNQARPVSGLFRTKSVFFQASNIYL